MPKAPKTVLRTEVPIIGEANSFREAMNMLIQKYIQPALEGVAQDILSLHNRLSIIERESFRRVNVYINPKEPDMGETIASVKSAIEDLLAPPSEEKKDDSPSQEITEERDRVAGQ